MVRSERGDLYVVILDSLGKKPPKMLSWPKTNTKEANMLDIEFYFKLKRTPKTKKVTVQVEEEQ